MSWPKHWIETDLDTIVTRMTNGTGSKQVDSPFENSYPITRIETIAQGTIDLTRVKYTEAESDNIEKYGLLKGDILFSHINSDKHLGKTALFDLDETVIHGINLLLIRAVEEYDSSFLNYLFRLYRLEGKFIEVAQRAVNQSSINQKKLKSFKVPLPPLAEQKRIVAKLDEAFQHLDNIKNRWEGIISLHSKYIKACLIDVEEDAFYTREKLAKYLEESTERIGSDWHSKIKVGVSAQKGIIELETGQKETFEKYKIVRPGDFVYNAMRVNIGSIAIYEGDEIGITSPDYIVFRVKKDLSPKLLLGFLKSEMGLLEINANTKGSVRSRLYFKNLANINYSVAPLHIQEQAEQVLSWYSSAISKWRKTIEPSLAVLSQAILAKAFRGELVPQNPTDEPASVLLEKIKAAKAAAVKPGKGKKAKGGKQGELVL